MKYDPDEFFFKRDTKTVLGNVEVEKAVAIPLSGENV